MLNAPTRTADIGIDGAVAIAVREDFTAFSHFGWLNYEHYPHLELIDRNLEQVARYVETGGDEGIGNLMIEVPPRHGKTRAVSQLFPAWFLGRNPHKRVIMASYGASLAIKNSRQVRSIIRTPRYKQVFGVVLAEDSQAKDHFDVYQYEGGLDSVGKGGAVTGKGADLLITDDLVKSRAEVESQHMRDMDWDWLTSDLLTRKQPGAAHVSVMTRWHQDDIHGRLILEQGDKWTRITLPALAEENDMLGRAVGEALCPEWYDHDDLMGIKADIGEYPFTALYQQRPTAKEGGLFKAANLQIIEQPPPDIIQVVRFWDLALSDRESADYTVGLQMGLTKSGALVVLDIRRFQKEWDDVPQMIKDVTLRDGRSIRVGIEKAFYQSRAVKKLVSDPALFPFSITGYPVEGDKYTRALPFAARAGERLVYVLRRAWTSQYIDELTSFNLGAHDDQVDASSGALLMLEKQPLSVTTVRYA